MRSSKNIQKQQSIISQSTDIKDISNIDDTTLIDRIKTAYLDIFTQQSFSLIKSYQFPIDILNEEPTKVLSCTFDNSAQFLASANSDGQVNIAYLNKNYTMIPLIDPNQKPGPATCVKWRPSQMGDLKNTLIATYSTGHAIYWHATSKQALFNIEEKDNQINCCEFTYDGNKFVTGGSDCQLKLYDCNKMTKMPIKFIEGQAPIHQNRIFGIKFNQSDHNQLYTGGWDKVVIQWDLRQSKSTGYIYGPCVFGDAIDSKGFQLLTASYREEKQLELWDTRTLGKIQQIEWQEVANNTDGLLSKQNITKLYTCKFDKKTSSIYSANVGSQFSEIRQFDGQYRCISSYCCSQSGILSIDHNANQNKLCYGTQDGQLGVLNIVN